MPVSMAAPWKHPKTGVYYLRRRVPTDLVAKLGKREEKQSLATKDVREAKKVFAAANAEVEAEWERLRDNPSEWIAPEIELTHTQLHALAGEIYEELIAKFGDNPGRPSEWRWRLDAIQRTLPEEFRDAGAPVDERSPQEWSSRHYKGVVDGFLKRRGLKVTPRSRFQLYQPVANAVSFAYRQLLKQSKGDYSPDPNKDRFPPLKGLPGSDDAPWPWEVIYERFVREAKQTPATQKRAKGVLRRLFAFLGHDDLSRVTKQDMLRWKDHNLDLGKSNETVRDADMAHPKALFRYAVEKGLPIDPTQGIRVRMPKKVKLREREFTQEEAEQILSWSLVPCTPRTSPDRAAAIRWIPWLCAYHGARVNEFTQLREVDVRPKRGNDGKLIWMLRITPEAGPVKDAEVREFALHPHLLEQGFVDYVMTRKGKYLFCDPSRSRGSTGENPLNRKVGEFLARWVRSTVGITDPNVAPNHGWRHLFRSRCRAQRIHPEIMDLLDGHQGATEGAKYGSLWPEVSLEHLSMLPRFEVKPARAGRQIPGAPAGEGKVGARSRKGEANYGKRAAGRPLRHQLIEA